MTNKQTIDGVSRGLLENCANYMEGSASGTVKLWYKELRALLDAPAKVVGSCKTCGGDGYLHVPRTPGIDCPDCDPAPAAQHLPNPAWYEHSLCDESGKVISTILADHNGPAFGAPDVDYDKLFSVRVEPLFKIHNAQPQGEPGDSQAFEQFWYSEKTTAIGSTEAQKYFDAGARHGRKGLPAQSEGEVERLQRRCENAELALKYQTSNCETLSAQLDERDVLLREVTVKCNIGFNMREGLLAALSTSAEPKPRGEAVYQVCDGVNGWLDVDLLRYTACRLDPEEYEARTLYTEQPSHSGDANEMVAKPLLAKTVRMAFICKGCEGVYADEAVSHCDCMCEPEFIEGEIRY